MPLILIVEDTSADLRKAVDAAKGAGFTQFEVARFATDACHYLEKAIAGKTPLPDAMVIDLELNGESGFEVLRLWHGKRQLRPIPVVVWSVMGNREREMTELFRIDKFVSKEDGPKALLDALTRITGSTGTAERQTEA